MDDQSIFDGHMSELEDTLGFPLSQERQSPVPKPLVLVISGPTGVGKDAVIRDLRSARDDIHYGVGSTTRPMRRGDIDGLDYHFFKSKDEFMKQWLQEDERVLFELTASKVTGDYKGIHHFKGEVHESAQKNIDVVFKLDLARANTVREFFSEAIYIFHVAESEVALVKRLIQRKTETKKNLIDSVAAVRKQLTRMKLYDYVVVNQEGCLEKTVSTICSIIDAEKARVKNKANIDCRTNPVLDGSAIGPVVL